MLWESMGHVNKHGRPNPGTSYCSHIGKDRFSKFRVLPYHIKNEKPKRDAEQKGS